jgi:nicotinamide mononucleotide transporter
MNPWEALAALCGLANIVLLARRSVWNFPFGMAMVAILAALFLGTRLYAVAGLQLFFFAAQVHGLWAWRRAAAGASDVAIRRLPRRRWPLAAALGLGCSAALALLLARTDAAAPLADGAVAGWSLVAQMLTNGRYVESWPLWVGINIVSVGLYASQALWITAALYGVFLGLALWSWRAWAGAAEVPA